MWGIAISAVSKAYKTDLQAFLTAETNIPVNMVGRRIMQNKAKVVTRIIAGVLILALLGGLIVMAVNV